MTDEQNVLGTELEPCSEDPMTGYLRDGCCHHLTEDAGRHEICAVMTAEFLEFSRARGNDLVTPRPELEFPGLEPGDRWCLCLGRWVEAHEADVAPPVVLEATNESVLEDVYFSTLNEYEYDDSSVFDTEADARGNGISDTASSGDDAGDAATGNNGNGDDTSRTERG